MERNRYFLGADVGGTRTRVLIADGDGQSIAFTSAGPGNPDMVKLDGFQQVLGETIDRALKAAGLRLSDICGAGMGIAGYDWPSQYGPIVQAVRALGLDCPLEIANDAIIGMIAGSRQGWGVGLVSGTGCNCWGWDAQRTRIGRVTGGGDWMGEAGGASEMMAKAQQAVAHMWTLRGPQTCLADMFIHYTGAPDLPGLLEGIMTGAYELDAAAAPLIFEAALMGDAVAKGIVEWGGRELGEMANAVIRQLGFQSLEFDLVLVGSTYDGGAGLLETVEQTVCSYAPRANIVRLGVPPVVGAVLLGIEQVRLPLSQQVRQNLEATIGTFRNLKNSQEAEHE